MPTQTLSSDIISAAIEGFEAQKRRIDEQIAELRNRLQGGSPQPSAPPQGGGRRGRRKLSADARARIAEAQRKRWAASKGESSPAAAPAPQKRKRRLSAAGRQAIIAATKKRWAAVRAAKEQAARGAKKSAGASSKRAAKRPAGRKRAASTEQSAESATA